MTVKPAQENGNGKRWEAIKVILSFLGLFLSFAVVPLIQTTWGIDNRVVKLEGRSEQREKEIMELKAEVRDELQALRTEQRSFNENLNKIGGDVRLLVDRADRKGEKP